MKPAPRTALGGMLATPDHSGVGAVALLHEIAKNRQGLTMSWPGHINDVGGIRTQFHHIIDIVPTILEAAGIPQPETVNGIKQDPIEGTSMVYTWDKANTKAPSQRSTQYLEMLGNRAIYHEGWVACTTPATTPWVLTSAPAPDVMTGYQCELYNVAEEQAGMPVSRADKSPSPALPTRHHPFATTGDRHHFRRNHRNSRG